MKKLLKLISCGCIAMLPLSLFAQTASISGTALTNVSGVAVGDLAVLVVDTSGTGFNAAALSSLAAGADLTSSATYTGFEVLTTTNAFSDIFFGDTVVEINAPGFDVASQPIVSDDFFGILTFDGGSTTATASSSYEIWTAANWIIPSDGGTGNFGINLSNLNGATAGATGTVVPEPSAYALIAGFLGLGWVMLRRR